MLRQGAQLVQGDAERAGPANIRGLGDKNWGLGLRALRIRIGLLYRVYEGYESYKGPIKDTNPTNVPKVLSGMHSVL